MDDAGIPILALSTSSCRKGGKEGERKQESQRESEHSCSPISALGGTKGRSWVTSALGRWGQLPEGRARAQGTLGPAPARWGSSRNSHILWRPLGSRVLRAGFMSGTVSCLA